MGIVTSILTLPAAVLIAGSAVVLIFKASGKAAERKFAGCTTEMMTKTRKNVSKGIKQRAVRLFTALSDRILLSHIDHMA